MDSKHFINNHAGNKYFISKNPQGHSDVVQSEIASISGRYLHHLATAPS